MKNWLSLLLVFSLSSVLAVDQTDIGVHVLIADYSNGGSERFLSSLDKKDCRPLKPGDKVTGTVRMELR